MKLRKLPYHLTVCKVESLSAIDLASEFFFIGRTDEEISLVCRTEDTPVHTTERDDDWCGFRIEGVLDFSLIGILSKLSAVLAENGIGIFAVSTYNTDYILVKAENFDRATAALAEAGYEVAGEGPMMIRRAREEDVMQIAEILVEDWQTAYRGIMDDDFLDSLNPGQRYQIEIRRYEKYTVAVENDEVLGYAWNEITEDEAADCEIIALYVRYSKRNRGIGKALMQNSMESFRKAGKKSMIVWCLRDNHESQKFYEKMGGKAYKDGTHRWGDRDYGMIAYLYSLD